MRTHNTSLVLAFTVILSILGPSATGLWEPFTVSISPDASAVYAGRIAEYNATITNDMAEAVDAEVFVRGRARTPWITLNTYSLTLQPGETKSFTFYLNPPYGTAQDTYIFDFTVASKTNSSASVKTQAIIFVLETSGLNITTFKASKNQFDMGEKITLLAGIKNSGTSRSKRASMDIKVSGATSGEHNIIIPPLEVDEEMIFNEEFIFDKYASHGNYTGKLDLFNELGDNIGGANAGFSVETRALFEKSERATSGLLTRGMEIIVKNIGNEKGTDTIMQDAPLISSAYAYEILPAVEVVGGQKKMVWECELEPNETCTIKYEVKYWMYIFAVLIAVALLYSTVQYLEKPGIRKTYVKGVDHKVHLEVKNNSRKTLEDVQVSDFVPSAFEVIENIGTVKPSIVKRRTGGTDIAWNLGKLAPGEERVFTYKVRPAVDVMGRIHLPHAKIVAKDEKGRLCKGVSSKIAVD